MTSSSDPSGVTVEVQRNARNDAYYSGQVQFTNGASDPTAPTVSVADGDTVGVHYGGQRILSTTWRALSRAPDPLQLKFSTADATRWVVYGAERSVGPGTEVAVYTSQSAGTPAVRVRADAAGRFEARWAPGGTTPDTVWVDATESPFATSGRTAVERASILGRVMTPGGWPARSALGDLRLTSDPDPCAGKTNCTPASNITDRDGRWAETQAQPSGEYRYQAVPQSDIETTQRHGYHDWGDSPVIRFQHTDDATTTDAGTVEVLAPNLTGRVVDEDGRGVPGSDVRAERSDGTFHAHTIANEPDGAYGVFFGERANQPTPDGTYVLTATAPLGCALLESEPVTVTYSDGTVSPSQADLVLRRPPGWGDSPGEGWDVPVEADADGTVSATVPTPAGEVTLDLQGASGSGSLSATCVALPDDLPVDAVDPPVDLGSTVDFEQATVCVPYTDAAVASSSLTESELALLHVDDADRVTDITSQVDTSANQVCGVTPSFSRFLVGRAQDPAGDLGSGIQRWYGSNRFETAAAVSARSFEPGVPVAYLATGEGFADALTGGPAAARRGGPILLTGRDALPQATVDELRRLRPGTVTLLGGTAVISEEVQAAAGQATGAPTTRLAGSDRYTTAAEIATSAFPGPPVVYVATGSRFPDALTGGVPAALERGPILLTGATELPAATAEALRQLTPDRIVVLGGPAAVSDQVAAQLADHAPVTRHFGADRYGTAASVIAAAFPAQVETVVVATGERYPDALTGVPAAFRHSAPLVIVGRNEIPQAIADELARLSPRRILILGGPSAVSSSVEQDLRSFVR